LISAQCGQWYRRKPKKDGLEFALTDSDELPEPHWLQTLKYDGNSSIAIVVFVKRNAQPY